MTTTSTASLSRAAPRKARSRGASLVEALIIIASMSMMFLAMVFFRVLYVNSMIISRLARAGGIAYSMSGCKDIAPKDWIARDAKPDYTILPPNPPANEQAGDKAVGTAGSQTATSTTKNIPGMSGGSGFLNPIAEVSDLTKVSSSTKPGLIAARRTIFSRRLQPRTFVTCGDIVRNGSFDEVFDYVKDAFDSKVKTKPDPPPAGGSPPP
jgi:hypothetical protein